MGNSCLHPIEMGTVLDWIVEPNTLILLMKCRSCGTNCKITVVKGMRFV